MNDRLQNERAFHDKRFGGDDAERQRVAKYYSISKLSDDCYKRLVAGLCAGADLLEYGCGAGSSAFYWAEKGANVRAIDISGEGVEKAKKKAEMMGSNILFLQMNAEEMAFERGSFDVVTGTSIIHHLNLNDAYRELSRVLRDDGHAVFVEPLGHNPAINLYRKLTPALRTKDEHPLLMRDIEEVKRYFTYVQVKYFHIFTLLAVPFRVFSFFEKLLNSLYLIDKGLMNTFPFLRRYAWIVVIDLHKPRRIC